MPDWSMDGGGLHQTLRGGHLNIHADFTTHHQHENWARRVNILLYLNREWRDEWGGKLELWDKDMTACQDRVTPAGNRMLVFTTSYDSFHGHPDGLTCPRRRRAPVDGALLLHRGRDHAVRRSTNYRPRPTSGLRKARDRRRSGRARPLRPGQAPARHLRREGQAVLTRVDRLRRRRQRWTRRPEAFPFRVVRGRWCRGRLARCCRLLVDGRRLRTALHRVPERVERGPDRATPALTRP